MEEKGKKLQGKVAWVTGSSRGIGRALVEHLAVCGARVAVHGTRQDSPRQLNEGDTLDSIASFLEKQYGVKAVAVAGDLTEDAAVRGIVEKIHEALGPIDILVNCAGGDIGSRGVNAPLAGKPEHNDGILVSLVDIRTVLDRNLLTCILCCRAVAPEMMERKSGRIVNVGSIAGLMGSDREVIYATSKAAVHHYSRCLAKQLRPYDVLVNVVAPGQIVTKRFMASRKTDETMVTDSGTQERYGLPVEVARAVEFLVSDDNTYITGQVLRVDGGAQLWPS
jgi:3-oxoacyl-[acyl-carrier protein] reductase